MGMIASKGHKASKDILSTPTYIVAMEESTKDARRVAEMLEKLVTFHGPDAVKDHVHITPGINIAAWPKKIELAEYAIKEIMKKKTKEQISTLTWLETYTNRDKKGQVPERAKEFPLSHHIGCLWAHLYDWQMSADAGYPATVVFESDAVDPSLLGVELSTIQTVVNHAPKDFDLIFLTKRSQKGGKLASKFEDALGNSSSCITSPNPTRSGAQLIHYLGHVSQEDGALHDGARRGHGGRLAQRQAVREARIRQTREVRGMGGKRGWGISVPQLLSRRAGGVPVRGERRFSQGDMIRSAEYSSHMILSHEKVLFHNSRTNGTYPV